MKNIEFYVPMTGIKKSEQNNLAREKVHDGVVGKIRGFASTPDIDYQNEQVIQEGLDITSFLEKGFLNVDHDNSRIVGYPDKLTTKVTKDGFYLEGYLFDTEDGRRIWETANALQKSNTDRRLGFSIEGQILKQDKNGRIEKARVTNVAVTSTPVNSKATWNAIAKSMTAIDTEGDQHALIRESLESAKIYCEKGLDGNREVIESITDLRDRLNGSNDEDDIRLYLMLFEGLEGKELAKTTRQILEQKEA